MVIELAVESSGPGSRDRDGPSAAAGASTASSSSPSSSAASSSPSSSSSSSPPASLPDSWNLYSHISISLSLGGHATSLDVGCWGRLESQRKAGLQHTE